MNTTELIDRLEATLNDQVQRARTVRQLPAETHLHRPAQDQWNTLEIFEHMCLSSGIYLRGLEHVFDGCADNLRFDPEFRPGMLGEYFTKSMLPRPDGTISNRMRTMRMFDPPRNSGASLESIDRFIDLCERFSELLERARKTDLNRMKVSSSLGPIIRFKAGDAFRFPIAHQQRHFLQLERTLLTAPGVAQRTTTNR